MRAPDFSRRIVAVNVEAVEFGKSTSVVNRSTRQRAKFGMRMFDGWGNVRSRSEFTIEIKWMAAFIHAPPIILATPDEMSRFPKVLAVVAGPDLSGLLVDAKSPRIAQPVGPVFRPS